MASLQQPTCVKPSNSPYFASFTSSNFQLRQLLSTKGTPSNFNLLYEVIELITNLSFNGCFNYKPNLSFFDPLTENHLSSRNLINWPGYCGH